MATLNAVLEVLYVLRQRPVPDTLRQDPPITFETGDAILAEHANAILGPRPADRNTRIMVTMPSEAADDPKLIRDLAVGGMNVMRINCAHDDPKVWGRMLRHLRQAEKESGCACKVSFDLAGPKLRTGPIAPGAQVAKWRPQRNALGQVTVPATVRFVPEGSPAAAEEDVIPVRGELLSKAKPGDEIDLLDARERPRSLKVVAVEAGVASCEADSTAYVTPGTALALRRKKRVLARAAIGDLPPAPQALTLKPGDVLDVLKGEVAGRDAVHDADGALLEPAVVGCSLGEIFRSVRIGERVFFDDGKIAGLIQAVADDRMRVDITSAVGGTAKLRSEKGINLPDTDLRLPALTAKDIEDLAFVARHGDMVAVSFVQRPEDIEQLVGELERLDATHLGIVLKIETQQAFTRLPQLLLTAMRHPPVAVMVARGDLGVEVGFERLSEVQEEILWLCEAAHIPVIWATQVLESLAKGGMPSRAEVTDAAVGSRAECVMLNKGPYIRQTLDFLCDVLNRMASHQEKKSSMLRKLSISDAPRPARAAKAAEKP
jgi:pyruvate kinase